jgi:predicted RecB family endonuclease
MVVLASEQLWPSIQGLVYWQEHQGGLTDLCIYHTSDKERSVAPAQRLQWLCNRLYPRIQVRLSGGIDAGHDGGNGDPLIQPAAVRAQLRAWRRELADRRLVINATGGTKLMFAGVLDCLDLPDSEVVYRELRGDEWYRLTRREDGVQTERLRVPLEVTDNIPVEVLVRAQSAALPDTKWIAREPPLLSLAELVERGLREGWGWTRLRSFDGFAGAILRMFGIKQVCVNGTLRGSSGNILVEVDAIANHRGRLLLVECKGGRNSSLIEQIHRADALRRQFGGLNARALLIRTAKPVPCAFHDLAAHAQLTVIDASRSMEFFHAVARFCNWTGELPREIAAAQELLDQASRNGVQNAFSQPRRARRSKRSRAR